MYSRIIIIIIILNVFFLAQDTPGSCPSPIISRLFKVTTFCGAGDVTQGLMHVRQALYFQTTSPAQGGLILFTGENFLLSKQHLHTSYAPCYCVIITKRSFKREIMLYLIYIENIFWLINITLGLEVGLKW
jgi:hypothetical protein